MNNLNRLNGWQRLWLVLAGIYAIPVALVAYDSMPTQAAIDRNYANETIESVKSLDVTLKSQPTWQIRDAYKDLSDREIVQRIHEKWQKKNVFQDMEFQEIDKRYKEKSEGLLKERVRTVGIAFVIWIATVIGTYVFAWLAGWVYRGFRNPTDKRET